MEYFPNALEKLVEQFAKLPGVGNKSAQRMAFFVLGLSENEAEEFAQAIVQGGSLSDCISTVLKGVGGSISDLEVYKRAVAFYFPGADVRFSMEIDLAPAAAQSDNKPDKPKGLLLDLSAFL